MSLVFSKKALANPLSDSENTILSEKNETLKKINKDKDVLEDNLQNINNEISNLLINIDETNMRINQTQEKLDEAVLKYNNTLESNNKRLRELYKNNYELNFLLMLSDADDLSDFIRRFSLVTKIMSIDKENLNKVNIEKENVEKIKTELEELKSVNEKKYLEFNNKKHESQVLLDKLNDELKSVKEDLSNYERSLIENPKSIALNSQSSNEIRQAISVLREIRKQITTDIVDNEIVDIIENAKGRLVKIQAPPPSRGSSPISNNSIVLFSYKFLGTPYVWAGTSPSGFDCSGFTSYIYRNFGRDIGRTTYEQINAGNPVSTSNLQPGDLVFFGSPSSPHHVGIYVGNGQYIHSPRTGDVVKVSNNINSITAARRL